jgi:transposase InsO family protein
MPWKVQPMSEMRFAFVHHVLTGGLSVTTACRRFAISRKTGYKWLQRYRHAPLEPLRDRSRRPLVSPVRTSPEIELAVLNVRDQHGWGAPKIHALLRPTVADLPGPRTITRVLRRHGRIGPPRPEAPPADQRFQRDQPNQLWQIDFKGPLEVERQRVCPLSLIDDHSRYLLALTPCPDLTMNTAWEVLWQVMGEVGLPEAVLADNAFGNRQKHGLGLSWFDVRLIRCGIRPIHGRPYHPQTQGKVERFHGTLERELWPRVRRDRLEHFAQDLDHWRRAVYNTLRPHEALDQEPPILHWTPSPRKRPDQLPLPPYPCGATLRKVFDPGLIHWRHYRIRVGHGLVGQLVRLEERHPFIVIYYAWKEVRNLVIDQLDRYTVN